MTIKIELPDEVKDAVAEAIYRDCHPAKHATGAWKHPGWLSHADRVAFRSNARAAITALIEAMVGCGMAQLIEEPSDPHEARQTRDMVFVDAYPTIIICLDGGKK